jgi:Uncharacterized conserved protein (DUF2285)
VLHDKRTRIRSSWPYHDELGERFGVDVPSPPWERTPAIFLANWTRYVQDDGTESQRIALEKNEIAIIIDLERPLKRQFLFALKSAEREQEFRQLNMRKARGAVINYPTYLRILDAGEAGASTQQIAEVLSSNFACRAGTNIPRLVCDYRTAARKLRDGGYRALLEAR